MASPYAGLQSPPARRREILARGTPPTRRAGVQATAFEAITYTPPPWKKLKRFLLRGLTTKERLIVTLKYCERLTFAEIGAVLELPEKQVAALHRDIVRRVRRWVLADRDDDPSLG
jgi:DNA-directed RNA polymerase specialized sigma24 family protein